VVEDRQNPNRRADARARASIPFQWESGNPNPKFGSPNSIQIPIAEISILKSGLLFGAGRFELDIYRLGKASLHKVTRITKALLALFSLI
jgi:hypothetical protein